MKKIFPKLVVALVGLVLVLLAMSVSAPSHNRSVVRAMNEVGGQYMNTLPPNFEFKDLDGNVFQLSSLRGRVVFLNLWASWCPPCQAELPSMIRLVDKLNESSGFDPTRFHPLENKRFVMVAVSWDENVDELAKFLDKFPDIRRKVVLVNDPGGLQTRFLGTEKIPDTYIIDAEGRIVGRFQGERTWDSDKSQRLIQMLK